MESCLFLSPFLSLWPFTFWSQATELILLLKSKTLGKRTSFSVEHLLAKYFVHHKIHWQMNCIKELHIAKRARIMLCSLMFFWVYTNSISNINIQNVQSYSSLCLSVLVTHRKVYSFWQLGWEGWKNSFWS